MIIITQGVIYFFLYYEKKKFGGVNWIIAKNIVGPGEEVQITATNLGSQDRKFGNEPFQIEDQSTNTIIKKVFDKAPSLIFIRCDLPVFSGTAKNQL